MLFSYPLLFKSEFEIMSSYWNKVARERLEKVITQAEEKDDSELGSDPSPIDNVHASKYYILSQIARNNFMLVRSRLCNFRILKP